MNAFKKFNLINLSYTLLVIGWGAFVRASGSGAGCGAHWPLCNGEVLPATEQLKTLIEFMHRTSSGMSLMLVVFGYLWSRKLSPKGSWIRTSAFYSVIAIFMEAILGAGLVLLKLVEFDQSISRAFAISLHLVNTLFLVSALSTLTWYSFHPDAGMKKMKAWFPRDRFFRVCTGVFLLLGITGAITALVDTLFPATSLANGMRQDMASGAHFLLKLRVLHPIIAVTWIMLVFVWSSRFERVETTKIRTMLILGITTQFLLGFMNWMLMAPTGMQIVHLLVADGVFIAFWISGHINESLEQLPQRTAANTVPEIT